MTSINQQRVRKGLGAIPIQQEQNAKEVPYWEEQRQQPRTVSPSNQTKQEVLDPPASIPEDDAKNSGVKESDDDNKQVGSIESVEGEDALLDLDQLKELHDEAERMKALGNKHMAAQVRNERR